MARQNALLVKQKTMIVEKEPEEVAIDEDEDDKSVQLVLPRACMDFWAEQASTVPGGVSNSGCLRLVHQSGDGADLGPAPAV